MLRNIVYWQESLNKLQKKNKQKSDVKHQVTLDLLHRLIYSLLLNRVNFISCIFSDFKILKIFIFRHV
jgi:hypothetical protein